MRPTSLTIPTLLALSLTACGDQAEQPSADQAQSAEAAPHPDLGAYQDATFFLDFTFGQGPLPIQVPEGLSWEPDGTGYILSGTLDETPSSSGLTGGAALEIPTGTATVLASSTVEVIVVASADNAAELAVAYSTNEGQDSGWLNFEVGDEPGHFSFQYAVPPYETGSGDYIGLAPLSGGPVTVHAVVVRPVEG